MDLIGCVAYVHLDDDMDQRRAFLSTVMNSRFHKMLENLDQSRNCYVLKKHSALRNWLVGCLVEQLGAYEGKQFFWRFN
jgi:hypothetical protein